MRITNPTGSNSRSKARVARIVELGIPVARETKTTRAASPPFATRTLLSPAPAIVARSDNATDGDPAARRNIHQRTPLITIDRKLTATAIASSRGEALRIETQACAQSIVRANR